MNYNQERIRKLERLLIPTMRHEYYMAIRPDEKAQYKLILDELELEHGERVVEEFKKALRGSYDGVVI